MVFLSLVQTTPPDSKLKRPTAHLTSLLGCLSASQFTCPKQNLWFSSFPHPWSSPGSINCTILFVRQNRNLLNCSSQAFHIHCVTELAWLDLGSWVVPGPTQEPEGNGMVKFLRESGWARTLPLSSQSNPIVSGSSLSKLYQQTGGKKGQKTRVRRTWSA